MEDNNYSRYMEQQSFNGNITSSPNDNKKNKKMGYGKKVLVNISLGLFFGICAGLGFQAVDVTTEHVFSGIENIQDAIAQSGKQQDEETIAGESSEETGQEPQDAVQDTTVAVNNTASASAVVTDVTDVVKAVMPSVVSVSNNYIEEYSYFGQRMTNEGTASGSGIIVGQNDDELLIVSNYHVVSGAQELVIQFVDGSQAQAQLKGSNEDMDLAVVAIPISELSADTLEAIDIAVLGDSDSLTVGEPAIAIGNALGYGQSVTTGVISAVDRVISLYDSQDPYNIGNDSTAAGTFIQTDAAINPGNSGGALLNMKGEVIGINSNKIGGTTIEGMGYAIPISSAKPIIEELMQKETRLTVSETNQGYLGISGITVVDEYAQMYGMPHGVFISQVNEGTGAANAGLARGDVITRLNEEEITSMEQLQKELKYYAAGDTVTLTVMKGTPAGYEAEEVEVTLSNKVS